MAKERPVKIETYYDKYFNTVVYRYRGKTYEVEYARSNQCCVTPAHIQHRDAQDKIDQEIDNPKVKTGNEKSFTEQLDELWELMGW